MSVAQSMRLLFSLSSCLMVGAAIADNRWTPYDKSFSGPQVKAHYVHLVLSIDPQHEARIRKEIRESYAACKRGKEAVRAAGQDPGPLAPPPADGAPEKVKIRDVDVYYSAGQSATIVTESNFRINLVEEGEGSSIERGRRADCSLREYKSKRLYVGREDALCEVDLLKGRYHSRNCPWTAGRERQDSDRPSSEIGATRERAEAAQMKPSVAAVPGGGAFVGARATGEKRRIAGQECAVFDILNGAFERCFASPASSFAIPASHFAGRQAGLLLQNKWPMVGETLTATDVNLNIDVSKAIFDPPAGVSLDSRQPEGMRK